LRSSIWSTAGRHALTGLDVVAGREPRRPEHVQVHERPPRRPAPDGDVVPAPAVVAGLDDPPVADRDKRRAGRGEDVLPLVHVAAAGRAEARLVLSEVGRAADGEGGTRRRRRAQALVGREPSRRVEHRRERGESLVRGRRGGGARGDGRHCRGQGEATQR
jgi:hypothetical protein